MSTSSSAVPRPPRVLRNRSANVSGADILSLDLAGAGLARLDPDRIDAAAEAGRAAGFAAGYAAGEAAGRAEAAALWSVRLAQAVHAGEDAISEALSGLSAVADATARRVTRVAFEIAEAVVGRELAVATNPGRDAVARVLGLAPAGLDLTLHLHPDDAAALGADDLPVGRTVTVVADPGIAVGDCVGRAGSATVDARIGPALERVRAVLEEAT